MELLILSEDRMVGECIVESLLAVPLYVVK